MYSEDSHSDNPEPVNFIDKVLDEMKNQFNKLEKMNDSLLDNLGNKDCSEVSDDGNKNKVLTDTTPKEPNLVSSTADNKTEMFLKTTTKFKMVNDKRKAKKKAPNNDKTVVMKRSSLRRGRDIGESILQCAIARKEKSYEASNPQKRKKNSSLRSSTRSKIVENGIPNKLSKETPKKSPKKVLKSNSSSKKDEVPVMEKLRKPRRLSTVKNNDQTNENTAVPELTNDCNIINETSLKDNSTLQNNICICSNVSNIYVSEQYLKEETCCAGLDSFESKVYSCSKIITTNENCLLRPSTRIPYLNLCKIHFHRMLKHHCCPTCGIFCTQGKFYRCEKMHLFHIDCQKDLKKCPHCDSKTVHKLKIQLSVSSTYSITKNNVI